MKPIITTAIVALTVAVAPIARAQQADDRTKQAVETMVEISESKLLVQVDNH
jgi:hypothetical protein